MIILKSILTDHTEEMNKTELAKNYLKNFQKYLDFYSNKRIKVKTKWV